MDRSIRKQLAKRLRAMVVVVALVAPMTLTAGASAVYCDGYSGLLPPDRCAFFDPAATQPWAQSPAGLEDWLSNEHLEYGLDAWIFYGSLTETSGRKSDFVILVQRLDLGDLGTPLYMVAVAYRNPAFGRYLIGGTEQLLVSPLTFETSPWKLTASWPDPRVPGGTASASMGLVSGQVGQPGAKYQLTADVIDQFGERLTADGQVIDVMGSVNYGFGPESFYPMWLTPSQRMEISSDFGGSVGAYLEATGDPMAYQGSYYHSSPLLKVQDGFTVGVGSDQPFATADGGTLWMDREVQSFDATGGELVADANWISFAIHLPSVGKALLVNQADTGAGRYRIPLLFDMNSGTTPNGARTGVAWPHNAIQIRPVPGSDWTSKSSGLTYPMEYRIKLPGGPQRPKVDLLLRAIMNNQEISLGRTSKYEGLMKVSGTIGRKQVRGQAWAELVAKGHD